MKVIEMGECLHDAPSGRMNCGIIIEATRDEIAAIPDNILYNEVTVRRAAPKPDNESGVQA